MPQILETEWFKKGYQRAKFKEEEDADLADVDAVFNDSTVSLMLSMRSNSRRLHDCFCRRYIEVFLCSQVWLIS